MKTPNLTKLTDSQLRKLFLITAGNYRYQVPIANVAPLRDLPEMDALDDAPGWLTGRAMLDIAGFANGQEAMPLSIRLHAAAATQIILNRGKRIGFSSRRDDSGRTVIIVSLIDDNGQETSAEAYSQERALLLAGCAAFWGDPDNVRIIDGDMWWLPEWVCSTSGEILTESETEELGDKGYDFCWFTIS